MFFRDRTNLIIVAFFVVSAVSSPWLSFSIRSSGARAGHMPFVPHYGVLFTMIFLTINLLSMLPCFAYVFDSREPFKSIAPIKSAGVEQALHAPSGESAAALDERRVAAAYNNLNQNGYLARSCCGPTGQRRAPISEEPMTTS